MSSVDPSDQLAHIEQPAPATPERAVDTPSDAREITTALEESLETTVTTAERGMKIAGDWIGNEPEHILKEERRLRRGCRKAIDEAQREFVERVRAIEKTNGVRILSDTILAALAISAANDTGTKADTLLPESESMMSVAEFVDPDVEALLNEAKGWNIVQLMNDIQGKLQIDAERVEGVVAARTAFEAPPRQPPAAWDDVERAYAVAYLGYQPVKKVFGCSSAEYQAKLDQQELERLSIIQRILENRTSANVMALQKCLTATQDLQLQQKLERAMTREQEAHDLYSALMNQAQVPQPAHEQQMAA